MKPDDLASELATHDAILQALDQLTEGELYRITMAAASYRRGSGYDTPEDLFHETIVRALNGAVDGEGPKRRWKKRVPFVAFLIQTMEGLANDSKENASRRALRQYEGLGAEGTTGEEYLGLLGHSASGHQDLALNAAEAQKDLDKIYDRFKDDDPVLSILLGREDGLSASEIQETYGISKKEYDAASKRMRRGFQELFPGR